MYAEQEIADLKKQLKDEFLELIRFDAPSWGEREIADRLKEKLAEMGFQDIQEDNAGALAKEKGLIHEYNEGIENLGKTGNVYAYLPGELDLPPILLSAHMDTVEPSKGKEAVCEADGTIRSAGKAVLGADCISGLVEILGGIRMVKKSGRPHRPVEILFPVAEETYCQGTSLMDFTKIKSRDSYVLDLTGKIGSAACKAPTLASFVINIKGRAAHAGMEPEKGTNAIAIMANLLTKIPQGHLDFETTCNVGMIQGGEMINIVSENCHIRGEVRSYNHEKALSTLQNLEELMRSELPEGAEGRMDVTIHLHSYETPADTSVVRRFQSACKELGLEGRLTETFGGSDQNPLSEHGIQGIVLSNGMYKMHTTDEYTTIEDLWQGSQLVAAMIQSDI